MPCEKTKSAAIYSRFEEAGLKIVAARMLTLTSEQAAEFYAVHRQRPFYQGLIEFMTSGADCRASAGRARTRSKGTGELMGGDQPCRRRHRNDFAPTSPRMSKRTPCTVPTRPKNAAVEIAFFFPELPVQ